MVKRRCAHIATVPTSMPSGATTCWSCHGSSCRWGPTASCMTPTSNPRARAHWSVRTRCFRRASRNGDRSAESGWAKPLGCSAPGVRDRARPRARPQRNGVLLHASDRRDRDRCAGHQPFPTNIVWAFDPKDQQRLRHWPDIGVRPGGPNAVALGMPLPDQSGRALSSDPVISPGGRSRARPCKSG